MVKRKREREKRKAVRKREREMDGRGNPFNKVEKFDPCGLFEIGSLNT